jgi:hypothetical protein
MERDEALDFIYKGWREGRQQRRDFANQRGADRISARRESMSRYGSPSMAFQNVVSSRPRPRRGPPSRNPPASTSPMPTSTFSDDVTTPKDESKPEVNEAMPTVDEAVSSPPIEREIPMGYNEAMANLDRFGGGSGRPTTRYSPTDPKPSKSNFPTPANSEYAKPENYEAASEEFEPRRETPDLSEANTIIDGKVKYNLDGERIKDREPVPMSRPASKGPIQTPSSTTSRIPEPKSSKQQHKDSFEQAYRNMIDEANEESQPSPEPKPKPIPKPKAKGKLSEDETNMGRALIGAFKDTIDQSKKEKPNTPSPKKKERKVLMDTNEGEDPKAMYVRVGDKFAHGVNAARMVREGTHKWGRPDKDGRNTIIPIKAPKIDTKGKKPNKKALTDRLDDLAALGQGGKPPQNKG